MNDTPNADYATVLRELRDAYAFAIDQLERHALPGVRILPLIRADDVLRQIDDSADR